MAKNRQKAVESRHKAVKIPPSVAPISTKSFVSHPCSRDILFTDRQTEGQTHTHTHTDQWNFGSRDLKTCFGTKN
jgi:hypothetical protein